MNKLKTRSIVYLLLSTGQKSVEKCPNRVNCRRHQEHLSPFFLCLVFGKGKIKLDPISAK